MSIKVNYFILRKMRLQVQTLREVYVEKSYKCSFKLVFTKMSYLTRLTLFHVTFYIYA